MSKCPVCNTALTTSICPVCGYDRSRDYAQFPTFGPLRGSVSAVSRTASPPMLCPGCGGAHFLLHRDASFTCASCGKKLELPQVRALTHTAISSVYAGKFYTGAITSGGSAAVVGDNDYGQCDVGDWKDLKALALGHTHTVGLKKDGTVVSVGYDDGGLCDTQTWRNIAAISAGLFATVGVQKNGTMVLVGNFLTDDCNCNVSLFTDIQLPN